VPADDRAEWSNNTVKAGRRPREIAAK